MKRIISLVLFIALCFVLALFLYSRKQQAAKSIPSNKLPVFASIYPESFFAQQVGGDKVQVTTVTPAGVEPHDFEPNPGELAQIYSAKLLILNGANMDPWGEKIKADLTNKGIIVVTASDGIDLINKDGQPDPHFWLDPVSAQRIVLNIRDGLVKADPKNEAYYRSNADGLIVKLINLDNFFKRSLFDCRQDTVIASHSVFGYLSARYRFNQETLAGLSPDEEPSSQRIADIVSLIKSKNVKIILTESLLSPKLSETIARETGAIVQVFNPLETLTPQEIAKNEDYFTLQDVNRMLLTAALQCTPTQITR